MQIEFVTKNYGYDLVITADNVNITEDVQERIYYKDAEGKSDFNRAPKKDVKDEYLSQIVSVLDDMIYYREREFDSSSLIERLFEKLPQETAEKLALKLSKDYEKEIEE